MKTVIVRYGELALKSEPVRKKLEDALIRSIRLAARERKYLLRRERGRIFIDCRDAKPLARRIARLPGVTSTSPAIITSADMDGVIRSALKILGKSLLPGKSFAVRTTRVGEHAFTSMEVCSKTGSAVLERFPGARVDLSSPDFEINVEIREGRAYVYMETFQGTGGLPIGSQGKIVALMRGHLQDALAAYLMMKRGAVVIPIFLHEGNEADESNLKKVKEHVRRLQGIDPDFNLRIIRAERGGNPLKKAESFAKKVGAKALVIGGTLEEIEKFPRTELLLLTPVAGLEGEMPLLMERAEFRKMSNQTFSTARTARSKT